MHDDCSTGGDDLIFKPQLSNGGAVLPDTLLVVPAAINEYAEPNNLVLVFWSGGLVSVWC